MFFLQPIVHFTLSLFEQLINKGTYSDFVTVFEQYGYIT